TAPATKPVPVTVSVNAGLPAARLAGFSAVIVGTGLMAATVTVGLVAILFAESFVRNRPLHVVAVAGAVKVSVAPVEPAAGAVFEPFRYCQSMYGTSAEVAGPVRVSQS